VGAGFEGGWMGVVGRGGGGHGGRGLEGGGGDRRGVKVGWKGGRTTRIFDLALSMSAFPRHISVLKYVRHYVTLCTVCLL
jgi:hypothetical protein